LPLVFELDAASLADAVQLFSAGAADAVERTRREIEDLRREAASRASSRRFWSTTTRRSRSSSAKAGR
jgi:hypothetical protein